jgi:phosphoserine phosphatase
VSGSIPDVCAEVVLAVDLDGSLIDTDLLKESVLSLLRSHPLALAWSPAWLARGRARFKHEVAARVDLDITAVPYRQDVMTYLRRCRDAGRTLVLATASNEKYAAQVADHLGLFDEVLASDLAVWRHARGALLVNPSPALLRRVGVTCEVLHAFG